MATHLGLCVKCMTTKECATTNQGSVCPECLGNTIEKGEETIITTDVDPNRKSYVVVESEDPLLLISLHGIVYAFDRKVDAEDFLKTLRDACGASLGKVWITHASSTLILDYVTLHPELRLLGIAGRKEAK